MKRDLVKLADSRKTQITLIFTFVITSCAIDRSIVIPQGTNAKVVRVIDGSIEIETDGSAESLRVIDGNITMRAHSSVTKDVKLTDGILDLSHASIERNVVAHHADIQLDGVKIGGDVELYCTSGEMKATTINGELKIRKRALWYVGCGEAKTLIIGPGTRIGKLNIQDSSVDVQISDAAIVHN